MHFEADGKLKTLTRRDLLKLTGAVPIGLALSDCTVASQESSAEEQPGSEPRHLYTKDKVPDPENVTFLVQSGKAPTKLVGHY